MRFSLALSSACHLVGALALSIPPKSSFGDTGVKVVYVQENNPTGNFIIATEISELNGTLSNGVKTSTGGFGAPLLVFPTQGAICISGNYLFTTNAGDNSLSMFWIDPFDPLHPRLIGTPAPTLGNTPATVTYSRKLNQACVANGGGQLLSVTCFTVDPVFGVAAIGGPRPIPQPNNPIPPANATPGIVPGVPAGDILFNPSQTAVFVTIYNSTAENEGPGFIYTYPVVDGFVSYEGQVTTMPYAKTPFSLNFIGSDEKAFLTNPRFDAPGAVFLDIASDSFEITPGRNISIPYQFVACWAAYSPEYDSIFVLDARMGNVTHINATTGDTIRQTRFDTPGPNTGATDSLTLGNYLYVLTAPYSDDFNSLLAAPQVLVYDMTAIPSGGAIKLVQSFDIWDSVGFGYEYQGLSVWPFIDFRH